MTPQEQLTCSKCLQKYGVTVCNLSIKVSLSKVPRGIDPEQTICPSCDIFWEQINEPGLPIRKNSNNINNDISNNINNNNNFRPLIPSNRNNNFNQQPINDNNIDRSFPSFQNSYSKQTANNNNNTFDNRNFPLPTYNNRTVIPTPFVSSNNNNNSYNYSNNNSSNNSFSLDNNSNNKRVTNTSTSDYGSALTGKISHQGVNLTDLTTSFESTPLCQCSMQSKVVTTTKEGDNKGRTFYACSKPRFSSLNIL